MTFEQAKSSGKQVRFKTWWWGRWIKYLGGFEWLTETSQVIKESGLKNDFSKDEGWELYDENKHGIHNAEKT